MDTDCLVVFCTIEVVGVSAGQAAIARVTAGLCAAVRIPVVGLVVFTDDCGEVFAEKLVSKYYNWPFIDF